jgi:uncharacterized membrane protein
MVAGSAAFAMVLIEADSVGFNRWLNQWPRLFGVGAEGARQMLSTLAGSMMTVMGITFSMTLLALVLASSQYTSRILRNFMRSRMTASSIIASISQETNASIDRLLPEQLEQEPSEDEGRQPMLESLDERNWYPVPAAESGYIQSVNNAALLSLASSGRTLVRMEHGIGAFVVQNTALVSLALTYPPEQKTIDALNGAYSIGRHRTVEQDPAFGIRQIVDARRP